MNLEGKNCLLNTKNTKSPMDSHGEGERYSMKSVKREKERTENINTNTCVCMYDCI